MSCSQREIALRSRLWSRSQREMALRSRSIHTSLGVFMPERRSRAAASTSKNVSLSGEKLCLENHKFVAQSTFMGRFAASISSHIFTPSATKTDSSSHRFCCLYTASSFNFAFEIMRQRYEKFSNKFCHVEKK